ncbi:MAG: HsdM family class I SAM-dependent methyltransferase [Luteimonas sp.]
MAEKSSRKSRAAKVGAVDDQPPHELEFTANAAAWLTAIFDKNPATPFSSASCEKRSRGRQLRRDLTLSGKDGRPLVTGEVKLPYQKDGATPYHADVVKDARIKAAKAGAEYFFTWNVNECVLWLTEPPAGADARSHYRAWHVAGVVRPDQLGSVDTEQAIKSWLGRFVNDLAQILRGNASVGYKPPDARFVEALESAMSMPIRMTMEVLQQRYQRAPERSALDAWMRDGQGWVLSADAEGIRESLERASKFTNYTLVNKLVFYEALMKRYAAQLKKLQVPAHIDSGEGLRLHLHGYFDNAMKVTGDYETVFGEDRSTLGARIPFYADAAVDSWRVLIEQIHVFDFSRLDYEVIGNIFERLISPEERHKYGQFYTRAEVVDLINSFCIRSGEETVLDPSCGGGTFLVRAYARKRELAPGREHAEILGDLYGVDISPFATHLTTINLATRDLVQDENYPRIARSDFFDVQPQGRFISLPFRLKAGGLGKSQQRDIAIPPLDAVIGNPPYVRQEDIKSWKPKDKAERARGPKPGTKEFYRDLVKREMGAELTGRSDLHCYFWPHAAGFLKSDGWLCLLTSSQWLDVEYGFKLQAWLLQHFRIIAVIESFDEPWFVGARVATVATLLQRCGDVDARSDNAVRFVQLRQPIADLLSHDGTSAGAVHSADALRDELLALDRNTVNARYRARLVPQGELLAEGIALGRMMRGLDHGDDEDASSSGAEAAAGDYFGGKWGIPLRAPDLWFELVDRYAERFAPLGELADVKRGVTSGNDGFFYPKDVSAACLIETADAVAFEREHGVARALVADGTIKLVRCGEKYGELRPIEARYLEPEVHSLMEIKGYVARSEECGRMMLLVGEPKADLKETWVGKYIDWGEKKGWHKSATCAARATESRQWYDLTPSQRPNLILPKIQQYRLLTIDNPECLHMNCALLGLYNMALSLQALYAAVLNSSISVLSRILYARGLGNEGNIQLDVYAAKMMLVPRPAAVTSSLAKRALQAYSQMRERPVLQFLPEQRMREMAYRKGDREAELAGLSNISELEMADRHALDDAVLEMLGVRSAGERQEWLRRLYDYLRGHFELVRQKEEKAIANKNTSARRGAKSSTELAVEILAELHDKHDRLLLPFDDFVDNYGDYDTYEVPATGVAERHQDMFAATGAVRFMKGKRQHGLVQVRHAAQAELLVMVANRGIRGLVRLPLLADDDERLQRDWLNHLQRRDQRIALLAAERTSDADLQQQILETARELALQRE